MADILGQLMRAAPGLLAARQAGVNTREAEDYKRQQEAQRQAQEAEARRQAMQQQMALMDLRRQQDARDAELQPQRKGLLAAQIADYEAQVAGTGRYAPKPVAEPKATPHYDTKRGLIVNPDGTTKRYAAPDRGGDGTPSGPLKFTVGNGLRDDFQRLTKPYEVARVAYQQMLDLSKDNSGASDINLLVAAAKAADPESVVREGEVAIQRTAASLAERIGVSLANLTSGKVLTESQRQKLIAAAGARVTAHRANYERYRKQYGELAKKYGGDPWDVTGDDPETGAAAPAAGPPGLETILQQFPGQPTSQRPPIADALRRLRGGATP